MGYGEGKFCLKIMVPYYSWLHALIMILSNEFQSRKKMIDINAFKT